MERIDVSLYIASSLIIVHLIEITAAIDGSIMNKPMAYVILMNHIIMLVMWLVNLLICLVYLYKSKNPTFELGWFGVWNRIVGFIEIAINLASGFALVLDKDVSLKQEIHQFSYIIGQLIIACIIILGIIIALIIFTQGCWAECMDFTKFCASEIRNDIKESLNSAERDALINNNV